ncbi:MAG: PKD domain-containing protein, partial [Chitinophagaceae bacterium]
DGHYEVCVRILYYGGCEAKKCQQVEVSHPDECRSGFIRQPGASINNPLRTEFKALPWHNNNKKPSKICWTFGDGQDACINYSQTYSGVYTVSHTYANAGEYEVCEKITYFGGCEKKICKKIRVPDNHEPHLILTPNPVHDKVHALYYATVAGSVNIRIFNTSNIQVRSYTRSAVAGINNWDFELGILLPGIYTFVVQSPNQIAKVMFLKI